MEKNTFSKKLKKIMRGPGSRSVMIFFLVFFGAMLVISLVTAVSESKEAKEQLANVQVFDPVYDQEAYSKVVPELLSDAFASSYEGVNYCFAVDELYYPYIVAIDEEDMAQYEPLLQYTYGETEDIPEKVELKGLPAEIDEEMKEYAVEYFNIFWGSDEVDAGNFDEVFGYYYLDTTQQPAGGGGMLIMAVVFAVMILVFLISYAKGRKKVNAQRDAALERLGSEMYMVDQEINSPSAVYMKQLNLYLTENYLVSSYQGFNVIRWNDLTGIWGHRHNQSVQTLRVADMNNNTYEVAVVARNRAGNKLQEQILDFVRMRRPDLAIAEGDMFYTGVKEFSGAALNKVPSEVESGLVAPPRSNPILGVIGAIIGAAIGGVLWVLIGKLGFIAGIAGVAMMYLAMQGYRIFSGYLDKKGEVISVIIALLMIPVANLMDFATEFCKYYMNGLTDFEGMKYVFQNLGSLISSVDGWGGFVMNLIVGYLLSVWSGFGMIKSVFSKRKSQQSTPMTYTSEMNQFEEKKEE